MPEYSIPPWLAGGSPLAAVQAGAALGARIAESNQRAAMEYASMQARQAEFSQQMDMENKRLQAQQEIQMMDRQREQQQLAIENARRDSELGLKRQALDLETKTASQKFAAQQGFMQEREAMKQQLLASGVPPDKAERKSFVASAFKYGPAMGMPAASYAPMVRPPPQPKDTSKPFVTGGFIFKRGEDGQLHVTGQVPEKKVPQPKPEKEPMVSLIPSTNPQDKGKLVPHITGIPLSKAQDIMGQMNQGASVPAAQPKMVRVKSPQGQTGSIPESQLEAAKKSGYETID